MSDFWQNAKTLVLAFCPKNLTKVRHKRPELLTEHFRRISQTHPEKNSDGLGRLRWTP